MKPFVDSETGEPVQLELAPGFLPEIDKKLAAADAQLLNSESELMHRRLALVMIRENHDWKAAGYATKREFDNKLAKDNHTTARKLQRWTRKWNEREEPSDLLDKRPGPLPGTGSILDADVRAHIRYWWMQGLTPRQIHCKVKDYREGKQNSPGCRVDHQYSRIPSLRTTERVVHNLPATLKAAREGPDKLKAACGHIDRKWDCLSLDRVAVDEWITDLIAYDPKHAGRTGRYYLLTILDERSIYPLCWALVEHPNEADEIDLLACLIREFGVPGLINSDRGRFRGRTFGGKFVSAERANLYPNRDGILDRLGRAAGLEDGIARNLPREHNPRGSRLERFHKELANFCRTLPGWCGRDTKERRMTHADALVEVHRRAISKGSNGDFTTPLLSRDELLGKLGEFMAAWRERPSEGTDMNGFSPAAVFARETPAGGFRRISPETLAWIMAEEFNVLVREGGIIQLADGKRYSHPDLVDVARQRRKVKRLRHDQDHLSVLPSVKGEATIIAKRRVRVGVNDPDELARQMEAMKRLRKLVDEKTKPLEYEPGAGFPGVSSEPAAPKATQVIHPSEFFAPQEAPPIAPENEISSSEYLMENNRYKKRVRVKPLDFGDLE